MSVALTDVRDRIDAACAKYTAGLGFEATQDWLVLKTLEEAGELVQAYLRHSGRAVNRNNADDFALKRDLDNEIADLLGFALVLAKRFDVDILRALERKWRLEPGSLGDGH
jgi:NTP pyrophosphatase (non-canonical NTP hydrolase)